MMKELYETPVIEITLFEEDDILTSSSGGKKPIETPIIPLMTPW